jgi:hypothetical protein
MKKEFAAWLILGIPTEADMTEATGAFALATRRLKTDSTESFTLEDLTAALSSVESSANKTLRFAFTVPANSNVITMTAEEARHVVSKGESSAEDLAQSHLVLALDALRNWAWPTAEDEAKKCLKLSSNEAIRDEALNIAAAAFDMQGEVEKAVAALKQAVQGEWNFSLQQNLGILAMETDPILAAQQATFWLDSAATQEDRASALFMVLNMWTNAREGEDGQTLELPEKLRESLRRAMSEDIPEEVFRVLGYFMADNDAEWTKRASNWVGSPHLAGDLGNMVLSRAESFDAYLEYLVANAGSTNRLVVEAVDDLVAAANNAMSGDEEALSSAAFMIQMLDSGLDCSTFGRALGRLLVCQEIALYTAAQDEEPTLRVFVWYREAKNKIESLGLESDASESISNLVRGVGDLLGRCYFKYRVGRSSMIENTAGEILYLMDKWTRRRYANKGAVQSNARAIVEWTYDTGQIYTSCLEVVTDPDLRDGWMKFIVQVNKLDAEIRQYA